MKRYQFVIVTSVALLATLCTLTRAGWMHVADEPTCLKMDSAGKLDDPLTSPAGLRWRQSLPNHWRACLLQR